jgi:hypothetical protein
MISFDAKAVTVQVSSEPSCVMLDMKSPFEERAPSLTTPGMGEAARSTTSIRVDGSGLAATFARSIDAAYGSALNAITFSATLAA